MVHAIICRIHLAHYRLRQYLRNAHKKVPLICEKHLPTKYSGYATAGLAFFTARHIVHWPIYKLNSSVNSNRDTGPYAVRTKSQLNKQAKHTTFNKFEEGISFAEHWKLVAESSEFYLTLKRAHRVHFFQLEIRQKNGTF